MLRYTHKMQQIATRNFEQGIEQGREEVLRAWHADWEKRKQAAAEKGVPSTNHHPHSKRSTEAVTHGLLDKQSGTLDIVKPRVMETQPIETSGSISPLTRAGVFAGVFFRGGCVPKSVRLFLDFIVKPRIMETHPIETMSSDSL